jgi:hypothetical protein
MNKTLFLAAILACSTVGTAMAAPQEWSSGFTQGVTENMIDDGNGNELNITCPSDEEESISAYATIAGKQHSSTDDNGGFDVVVDGELYSNPFFTDCEVCSVNFEYFWDALRKAKKLQISAAGKTVNLPTKGIQKALLPFKSKDNTCRTAW